MKARRSRWVLVVLWSNEVSVDRSVCAQSTIMHTGSTVWIVDDDPSWPQRFEIERDRIANALGPVARRIEHVGSTSVSGLAAKPVVDIMVTVEDPDDDALFLPALTSAGYVLRAIEPQHRLFRTP
jgi:GrpB-like predicted nucleotidyltransferase (UPF0157 family)